MVDIVKNVGRFSTHETDTIPIYKRTCALLTSWQPSATAIIFHTLSTVFMDVMEYLTAYQNRLNSNAFSCFECKCKIPSLKHEKKTHYNFSTLEFKICLKTFKSIIKIARKSPAICAMIALDSWNCCSGKQAWQPNISTTLYNLL